MPSILAIVLPSVALGGLTAASCSRAFLQNISSTYVAAQEAGDPSLMTALAAGAANFIYLENNRLADLRTGALAAPLHIDFHRSIRDAEQCATFTEVIAATDPRPHVIHTRIVLEGATGRAALMESVVTDEGDWLFDAAGTLALNAGEAWGPIPEEERAATRAEVQALGDAYFDRFGDASVAVPWSEPCYRLEGGMAARGDMVDGECVMVWPSTIVIPYRRYVVDVDMGAVDMFVGFPGLDRTQGQEPMPDSHLFRVERGRIKYSHTASACVVDGCGLNGTMFDKRARGWERGAQVGQVQRREFSHTPAPRSMIPARCG